MKLWELLAARAAKNGGTGGSTGGGSGLPEGGAPYQQLVTDGEGNAKWEDKPFYEKIGEVVIIPETTFVSGQLMGGSGAEIYNPNNLPLESGKTYTVKWDGVTHSVVAEADEPSGMVVLKAGEIDEVYNVISGCLIGFQPGNEKIMVITPDDWGTEHTLEITTIGTVIAKIDSKFMPDGYPRSETKEVEKVYTDFYWMYNQTSLDGLLLVEGRNYTVFLDDEKYEASAAYDSEHGYLAVWLIHDEDAGIRVALFGDGTGGAIECSGHDKPSKIVVKYGEEMTVLLNPKYAPNAVFKSSAYTAMMNGNEPADGDPIFTCNMSLKDAYAALKNGYGLNCMCLATFEYDGTLMPACWFGGVAFVSSPTDNPEILVNFSMSDKTIGIVWTPDEIYLL